VQQYIKSVINNFIAADAMVWHIYLLTTNDEHLFTGEAWGLCGGKRSKGFVRWVFFHSIHSIKKRKPPTMEADMMKKMNSLTVMKKQTHQEKQTSS
jgi:hypothetical protein